MNERITCNQIFQVPKLYNKHNSSTINIMDFKLCYYSI